MFFILILLAIAFGTILGLESYHAKRLLPKLVIAILLVNFSMMICGVIVDFSQILTLGFLSPLHGQSLEGVLLDGLQLRNYDIAVQGATIKNLGALTYTAILSLIVEIGILITLLVLLMMLVIRVVAIWILVTLSPLVFVAQILPITQQYAKKWWDEFLKYVMFGPAIAFFLLLTVLVIKGGDMTRELGNVAPVTNQIGIEKEVDPNPPFSTKGSASTFLQTVFILTLLGAGMFIAKQSSVVGAGMITGAAGKAGKWVGGQAGYLAKLGARKTKIPAWFKARKEKLAEAKQRMEAAERKRVAISKLPRKERKKGAEGRQRVETQFLAQEAGRDEIKKEAEARVEALKPEEISTTIGREKNPAMIYAMMKKAGQEGKLEPKVFESARVQKLINKSGQENLQKIASKKNPLVYYDKVPEQAKAFAKLSGDDLAKVSPDAIRGASRGALKDINSKTMARALDRGSSEFKKAVREQITYFRLDTQKGIRELTRREGLTKGPKVPGITKEAKPGEGPGRKAGEKGRGGPGGTV